MFGQSAKLQKGLNDQTIFIVSSGQLCPTQTSIEEAKQPLESLWQLVNLTTEIYKFFGFRGEFHSVKKNIKLIFSETERDKEKRSKALEYFKSVGVMATLDTKTQVILTLQQCDAVVKNLSDTLKNQRAKESPSLGYPK